MDLLNSMLSSMGPVSRFASAMILLSILFLIFKTMWIAYHRGKFSNPNAAKDIYVVTMENKKAYDREPSTAPAKVSTGHTTGQKTGRERRKSPRSRVECQVEFIKGGSLFKETSRDLSYTGIFLTSKMPDRYGIGDEVTLTFQLPKEGPKKRNGFIARKDESGIGISFVS